MGSDRAKLISRCCYAAVTVVALSVMFWIAWCLFGLTAVQVSEAQRRALVHYSSPTTSPRSTTTPAPEETSSNSISKLPTTASLEDKRKHNVSTGGPSPPPVKPNPKSSVVTGSGSQDDHIHTRRVLAPGVENRPEEKGPAESKPDIAPTRVHEAESPRVDSSRGPTDDVQSSRRSEPGFPYRDPDFDREEPPRRRVLVTDRDRGRDTDDRYSKGDKRVYPDDRYPEDRDDDDRYYERRRYRDDRDDRYRDEERYKPTDRDEERYKSRDRDEEKYRYRDDERYRYRDDERYTLRDDDRYRDRDDERPRVRGDEGYKSRDDERYRPRDDDKYRPRDDERYRSRDDDRYRPRDDERYRSRDDEKYRYPEDDTRRSRDDEDHEEERKYRVREPDRYRLRDDEVYRSDRRDPPKRISDDEDGYRPRTDVDTPSPVRRPSNDKEPPSRILSSGERKPTSSRYEYDLRSEKTVTDYDIPARESSRSRETPSRLPYDDEERYRERIRDDEIRRPLISPTRTREESLPPRSRGTGDDRSRTDDRYYDADRTRIQDSRSSLSPSESSRRYTDDRDRYRTRLPSERASDRKEEVVLDRRSYAAEDEEYRRRDSGRGSYDRDRRPIDDESYPRRDPVDEDEYRSRRPTDYDKERGRSRDRHDEDYRGYDDRYDDRRDDRLPPVRRPDPYPDDDVQPRRRYPETSRDKERQPPARRPYDEMPRSDVVVREKRGPLSPKEVIEAAIRQSDASEQGPRKVYYPVYDPRSANLTATEIIRQSERRGTTITERRRRSAVF